MDHGDVPIRSKEGIGKGPRTAVSFHRLGQRALYCDQSL